MISEEIGRIGLIPIAVFEREKDILPTAKALLQADIPVIEITFRTNLAEPAIKKVKQAFPEMLVGAGTILTKEQAYTAVKAGADFIVTPGLKEEVVKVCQEEETLIIPGCVTPSEISRAFELGIRIVKFFPASVYGGIKGCKALHGPFGNIKFVPTGGVGLENLQDYAKLPFIHAVGGGWLCDKKDMLNGNYARISETAEKSIDVLLGFGVIGEDSIPVSFHSVAENEKGQGKQSIYTNSVERAIYYLGKYGWKMEKREEDRVCLKDEQGAEVCLVQA